MSTHRIATAVLTPVILLCLTACGGDSSSEATPEATDEATPEATDVATPEATDEATVVPEPERFTISGVYAVKGGDPRSEKCVSGEDQIIVKSSTNLGVIAIGKTSAKGKFDKKAKACLYKFTVPEVVAVSGATYGIQVGNAVDIGFVRSEAEGLFITGTAP